MLDRAATRIGEQLKGTKPKKVKEETLSLTHSLTLTLSLSQRER